MRITISAVNSKGIKAVGIGDSLKDACVATIASGTRSGVEQAEQNDLAAMVSTLAFLADIGMQGAARLEGDFWVGRVRACD